jgi:hypothetical protein
MISGSCTGRIVELTSDCLLTSEPAAANAVQ